MVDTVAFQRVFIRAGLIIDQRLFQRVASQIEPSLVNLCEVFDFVGEDNATGVGARSFCVARTHHVDILASVAAGRVQQRRRECCGSDELDVICTGGVYDSNHAGEVVLSTARQVQIKQRDPVIDLKVRSIRHVNPNRRA